MLVSGRQGEWGCWGGRERCRGKKARRRRGEGFERLMKPGVGLSFSIICGYIPYFAVLLTNNEIQVYWVLWLGLGDLLDQVDRDKFSDVIHVFGGRQGSLLCGMLIRAF